MSNTTQCPLDFVVVGDSVAGIGCAFTLAFSGHRVTIVEKLGKVINLISNQLCVANTLRRPTRTYNHGTEAYVFHRTLHGSFIRILERPRFLRRLPSWKRAWLFELCSNSRSSRFAVSNSEQVSFYLRALFSSFKSLIQAIPTK